MHSNIATTKPAVGCKTIILSKKWNPSTTVFDERGMSSG